ncbi:MAG: hypothetical protein M1819_005023 [Sarea resinae]|nr:MAG: hypothetical protein M1819_005023 [Sarea resinae]
MSTPEEQYLALTKKSGHVDVKDIDTLFAQLKPVTGEQLIGEWTGGDFTTGHPGHDQLAAMKWAGKSFRTFDDVDPIVVYDDAGKRTFSEQWGHAVVREVKFNGQVSAAMIYDKQPIIDHFRYVNDNFIAGIMDTKMFPTDHGAYHFYLTRIE